MPPVSWFARLRVLYVVLACALVLGSVAPARANETLSEIARQILVGTPEGLEICSRLLGRPVAVAGPDEVERVGTLLGREELDGLRAEIEAKAERVRSTIDRRGMDWHAPEAQPLLGRAVAAEFMLAPEASAGEIDFVSGGHYDVTRGTFARAREAFLNGVQAVVPDPVLDRANRAAEIAAQLKDTAQYSIAAARIITGEALQPLKWVGPVVEVYTDVQKLAETFQAGRYTEVPEAAGALLKKGEDVYSGLVRMIEKLPPGRRRDAYVVVLGDVETLVRASRQAYDVAAQAVKVGGPVAADGVRVVGQAARAVEAAGVRLNSAIETAQDLTIGRVKRVVAQGAQWTTDTVEGRVAAQYDQAWSSYLAGHDPQGQVLLGRVRGLWSRNFGVPWPLAGRLGMQERAARLSELFDWATQVDAALAPKVTPLSRRAHPVLNHFVDVYLRGQGKVVADYLASGGEWESLSASERQSAVDAIRQLIDAQTDGILSADAGDLRPFVPEVDELKEFCRRWQQLTDIERRITVAVLLDFN